MKFYLSTLQIIIEADTDLNAAKYISIVIHKLQQGGKICDWKLYGNVSDPSVNWGERKNPFNIGEIDKAKYELGTGFDFANYAEGRKLAGYTPKPYHEWADDKEYFGQ